MQPRIAAEQTSTLPTTGFQPNERLQRGSLVLCIRAIRRLVSKTFLNPFVFCFAFNH